MSYFVVNDQNHVWFGHIFELTRYIPGTANPPDDMVVRNITWTAKANEPQVYGFYIHQIKQTDTYSEARLIRERYRLLGDR